MRLTNYYEHPADNRYWVFRFTDAMYASEFEALLLEREVIFEKFSEGEGDDLEVLYGIERRFFKDAMWSNHMVYARHRKPFIPNAAFKWFMLLFTASAIALAIIGYLKSS